MYCEKCCKLFHEKGQVCPSCGSRKIRESRVDDLCFLVEKESVWGEMLADVLTRRDIPFIRKPVLGAGISLKLGQGLERYRFYVHYGRLEEAREVLQTLFPEDK